MGAFGRRATERRGAAIATAAGAVEGDLERVAADKTIEWLGPARGGRVRLRHVAPAAAMRVEVPPLVLSSRGAAAGGGDAADADREDCLHLAVHGAGVALYGGEGGAEEAHGPGAVVLIDGARPATVAHPEGARVLVWSLPRRLVAPYLPDDLPPAVALEGAAARVVAAQAEALAESGAALPTPLREGVVENFAALVGLAVAGGAGVPDPRAGQAGRRHARVRGYLEARYRDPRLTAGRAARELGMSRRWLQAQFESGRGFAAALARRRLEAGLALLRDPAAEHLTVTEIAFAVGFNDLSTFHRRFRRCFGMTPGAARAAARERRAARR
jgi:AraC family transcriptional regulator, positive regulator of tynA and feaB